APARSHAPATPAGRRSTPPRHDGQNVVDQAQLTAVLNFAPIDPSRFPLEFPFVLPGSQDDMKRREPLVLEPSEFHAQVVRGGVLGHNLTRSQDGKTIRVQVLVDKQFGNNQFRQSNSRYGRMLGGMGRGGGGLRG